jgi:hypothetical protein
MVTAEVGAACPGPRPARPDGMASHGQCWEKLWAAMPGRGAVRLEDPTARNPSAKQGRRFLQSWTRGGY